MNKWDRWLDRKNINMVVSRVALSAVFIMGFISAFSVMERPQDDIEAATIYSPSGLVARSGGSRGPASVGSIAELGTAVLDMDCTAKSFHVISAQQVRLRGSLCQKTTKDAKVIFSKITNSTNGANATIFFTEGVKFTTDYIQLDKGVNKIALEYRLNNGSHIESSLEIQSE